MSEKASIARILSDFIKADNIIENGEIDRLVELSRKYCIDSDDKYAAQSVLFCDAVMSLRERPLIWRKEFVNELKGMTLSDGKCVPSEAMLMMAVDLTLGSVNANRCGADLLGGLSFDLGYNRHKLIYVESEYNDEINAAIAANYRYITSELNMIGIDFIYIPRVADDFKSMTDDYLKEVISYLVPNIKSDRRDKVCSMLRSITTVRFCQDLLVRKLGIGVLRNTDPSLLVTIGNSTIPRINQEDGGMIHDVSTQYLRLRIEGNVVALIEDFVSKFKEYVCEMNTTIMAPARNRIMYDGFHRSLLDMLTYSGKRQDCNIVVDLIEGTVSFDGVDEELVLYPKERALYLTILHQALCGDGKMRILDGTSAKVFGDFYSYFGSGIGELQDRDVTVLLSRIKKEVSKTRHPLVNNIDCFIPERKNGSVTVGVAHGMVLIRDGEKLIPLEESHCRLWGK